MSDRARDTKPDPVTLRHLSLRSFRNYDSLELELEKGLTLVAGPNGHGKTNLIEAIYFLCLGRSFRERREKRLIQLGRESATLAGDFGTPADPARIAFELQRNEVKTAQLDGTRLDRLSELVGRFPVVGLTPDDSGIVQGDPSLRRRFLDLVLAQTDRRYLDALRTYKGTLARRNKSLREGRRTLAAAYDESLVSTAVQIRTARASLAEYLAGRAGKFYREVSAGDEEMAIRYRPDPPGNPEDTDLLERTLADSLAVDCERGFTGRGPHRDELALSVNGRDLRPYGSHGQSRTALAALKLAEVGYFSDAYDRQPLLLLDEVASVLDDRRAVNLIGVAADSAAQVLVTTPQTGAPEGLVDLTDRIVTVDNGTAGSGSVPGTIAGRPGG